MRARFLPYASGAGLLRVALMECGRHLIRAERGVPGILLGLGYPHPVATAEGDVLGFGYGIICQTAGYKKGMNTLNLEPATIRIIQNGAAHQKFREKRVS